jgi:hypothetical protein
MSSELISQVDWNGLNWTALAAVSVFLASQLFNIVSGIVSRRRVRQNLAKALLAEIRVENETLLTSGTAPFNENHIISISKLKLEPSPSRVYEANIGNIGIFPRNMVFDIVSMYSKTDSMTMLYKSMYSEQFDTLPDALRKSVLSVIKKLREEHADLAKSLVPRLEKYTK